MNPQRFGKFRAVDQWRPGLPGFGNFRAGGHWRQPQAQQEMGHKEMGHLDQQTVSQAQSEAFAEGKAIGLHGTINGYGLGQSSVDHVFDLVLGPSSKAPPGQLTGQVEDPPVARVFELLRRSVGLPSSEGSSLARKDQRQSPMCSPPLATGPSQRQPEFKSEEVCKMLVLRSEGCEQEGDGLGCNDDLSMGLEGDLQGDPEIAYGESLPLVLHPSEMEVVGSVTVGVGTATEIFAGDAISDPSQVSA